MASRGVVASPSREWRHFGLTPTVESIWMTNGTWSLIPEIVVRPSDGAIVLLKEGPAALDIYKFRHPLRVWPQGAVNTRYIHGKGNSKGIAELEPESGMIASDLLDEDGRLVNTAAACAGVVAVSNRAHYTVSGQPQGFIDDVLVILPLPCICELEYVEHNVGGLERRERFRSRHAFFRCDPEQNSLTPARAVRLTPSGDVLPDSATSMMSSLPFARFNAVQWPYGGRIRCSPEFSSPFNAPEAPILIGEAAALWDRLSGDYQGISRIRYVPSRRGFVYACALYPHRPTVWYLDEGGIVHIAGAQIGEEEEEEYCGIRDGRKAAEVALPRCVVDVDMHPNGDAYICTGGYFDDLGPRGARMFKVEAASGCIFSIDLAAHALDYAFLRVAVHPADGSVFLATTSPAGGERVKQHQLLRVLPADPVAYREPLLQAFAVAARLLTPAPGGDKWIHLVSRLPVATVRHVIAFVPWPVSSEVVDDRCFATHLFNRAWGSDADDFDSGGLSSW